MAWFPCGARYSAPRSMVPLFAIIIAVSFVMLVFHYWRRLLDVEVLPRDEWKEFLRWVGTGVIAPFVLWLLFNTGWLGDPAWFGVRPISRGGAAWWSSFRRPLGAGLFFISSYWAGLAFVQLLCRAWQLTEDRDRFRRRALIATAVLAPGAVALIVFGQWIGIGLGLTLWGLGLVHVTSGLKVEQPLPPSYARAQVHLNFGRYEDAELEIIHELEQCEEDFDGWMLLAELYATHFNDLAGADEMVRDLCRQPMTTPSQIAVALHRLADWHLKLARDPVTARRVLEQICVRMPGTHMDRMARQRISQLPASREEFIAQTEARRIELKPIPHEAPPPTVLPRSEAAHVAKQCVEALKKNADDVAARERFARVLADSLGDAKTAIEQIELLLAMPKQAPEKRADWLLTIAHWHGRYRNDLENARLVYEEVMRDFPNSRYAVMAQCRLNLLTLQFRRRAAAESARSASIR